MGSAHADESAGSLPANRSETMFDRMIQISDLPTELQDILVGEFGRDPTEKISEIDALKVWSQWEIGDDHWAEHMLGLLQEMRETTPQPFYVIWRGDEDDFFVTRLDLDPLMMAPGDARLSNQQIVQMAWDAEHPGDTNNPFVGDSPESYEMIEVFSGSNVCFHMQ